MKKKIQIVFQEEYNLENQIGIDKKKKKIQNMPKQKFSEDENNDESDQNDCFEEIHDWELDFVINSPNSKFIALNISRRNDYEERSFFHVVIDTLTKKIRYQRKFYDDSKMLFSFDSKYLIIEDNQNLFVDLNNFQELKIDNKCDSIISISQENNLYNIQLSYDNEEKLAVFSISDNTSKIINIRQEILNEELIYIEKLFKNYFYVETLKNNFLVLLSNNNIIQRNLKKHSNNYNNNQWIFNNSFIIQQLEQPNYIYVKKLNNFKLIRKFQNTYDALIFKNNQSIYKYNFSQKNHSDGDKIERTNLITGIMIKPDLHLGRYFRTYYKQVVITEKYLIDLQNGKLRYFRFQD